MDNNALDNLNLHAHWLQCSRCVYTIPSSTTGGMETVVIDGSQVKRYFPRTFEHDESDLYAMFARHDPMEWRHEPFLAIVIGILAYFGAGLITLTSKAVIEHILLKHFPRWSRLWVFREEGQLCTKLHYVQVQVQNYFACGTILSRLVTAELHLWEVMLRGLLAFAGFNVALVAAFTCFELFIRLGQAMKDWTGWKPGPSLTDQPTSPPNAGTRPDLTFPELSVLLGQAIKHRTGWTPAPSPIDQASALPDAATHPVSSTEASRTSRPKSSVHPKPLTQDWRPVGPVQVPSPGCSYQAITSRPRHQHQSFEEMRLKQYDPTYNDNNPSPNPGMLDTNALYRYQNRLNPRAHPAEDSPASVHNSLAHSQPRANTSPSSSFLEATSTTASWLKYREEEGSARAGNTYSPHFVNGTPVESIEKTSFLGAARSTGSWLKSRLGDSFFGTPEKSSIGSRDSFGRSTAGKGDAAGEVREDAMLGVPDLLTGTPRRQFT